MPKPNVLSSYILNADAPSNLTPECAAANTRFMCVVGQSPDLLYMPKAHLCHCSMVMESNTSLSIDQCALSLVQKQVRAQKSPHTNQAHAVPSGSQRLESLPHSLHECAEIPISIQGRLQVVDALQLWPALRHCAESML